MSKVRRVHFINTIERFPIVMYWIEPNSRIDLPHRSKDTSTLRNSRGNLPLRNIKSLNWSEFTPFTDEKRLWDLSSKGLQTRIQNLSMPESSFRSSNASFVTLGEIEREREGAREGGRERKKEREGAREREGREKER